ncbi:hypothetical protein GGF46_003866 [Coemansia sp. RSA 552]|nr:hypothetical protein GGF46_003866 [Coemansia sp. RSA 552]
MVGHKLNIKVILDTVCPWCYIGKQRLDKALALAEEKWMDLEVTIDYAPYQLDSWMGWHLEKIDVYREKFGEHMDSVLSRITDVGRAEGIAFSFGGKTSNTLDPHRLIQYARQFGQAAQGKVVESVLRRYFELEQDIGDVEMLLSAAEDGGLDREAARAYLEQDSGTSAMHAEIESCRRFGSTGVPFYIIDGRFGVSGAQTPETFVSAFEEVFQRSENVTG